PFDLAVCAGVEDLDLQSHGAGSRVRVFQRDLRNPGIVRIDEYRHPRGYGYQVMQEFQALCRQLLGVEIDPRQIAPGRARLATRPSPTGSWATMKTVGIVVVAALAANVTVGPPDATITATCRRTSSAASTGSRSN